MILMNVIEFANEVSNTTDTPGTDKEEEASIGGKIVSVLGTMISIGLNLTPILLFYRYFKKTAGLETIPETMFITGIFCCATNLAYAIIISDQIMTISNVVCYGLQVAYGTIYIFITNHKRIDKLLLYLIIAWDLSFEVLFIFGNILEYHWGKDFADDFTGIVNISDLIINKGVIKNENNEKTSLCNNSFNYTSFKCDFHWYLLSFCCKYTLQNNKYNGTGIRDRK